MAPRARTNKSEEPGHRPDETAAVDPSLNGHAPEPPGEVVYNPLKLSSMRSKSDALKGVWVDPSRVPIYTRPEPNVFFRIRPGEEFNDVLDLLVAKNASNSKDRNPVYYATDAVRPDLDRFVKPHRVAVGIQHHDKLVFLWVRAADDGDNSWTESVWRAMDAAQTSWIALESNMTTREYDIFHAPNSKKWGPPEWPDQTLEEVVNLAFRDRIIDSLDHQIAQRLRGLD